MNGNSKQWLTTGVIALVVSLGGGITALTTLGRAAGLATEDRVREMIATTTVSKSAGLPTEDRVRAMIATHCPYTEDRNVIVESIAGLEAAVTANTNAMGTLQTTVAVLAERMKHMGGGG